MRIAPLFLLFSLAAAADNVVKVTVEPSGGKPVDVWLTRTRTADGGVHVKVVAKGPWPKPQALTIYMGGGEDDGYGDDDIKGLTMAPFDLPGGDKGVRVDLSHRVLGGKKKDIETETTLVAFGEKTHKAFELVTGRKHARSKVCREGEETLLSLGVEGELVTETKRAADATLGDDDLPVDKSCRAPAGATKKSFRWDKDHFVDPDAKDDDDDDDDE